MILDYLKYLILAKNEHSLHSPFLFEFYLKVLKGSGSGRSFSEIETLRDNLLRNEQEIEITDFGAGSKLNRSSQRKIKDIAKNSQKPARIAQLFYRIIKYYNYETILDLGTSLGVTTAYLANANTNGKVYTFEGCPNTAQIAMENFGKLGLHNVEIIVGDLYNTLGIQLEKIGKIDFAFFDANHRYEPTVNYFEKCLSKIHEDTCFVFDDIYWSEEMKKAWEHIINQPQVSISIDIFWIGIVFFRKKQQKQHFVLRF
ncbi:O-methyltransferase [Emticicia sp. BO119]|uniref:O-methyltransferase n=1 Tax=Emticicia sp. BO119 TaxID=2757768 RepID=UPI0015F063F6|nr:class I SAM-dependent methyltransferase [Emticicia sp. BO119]MBA4849919.1 class I SAM-dependent methyltransferase [Emticicia sp. BO119]